jgi:hypothetical protein
MFVIMNYKKSSHEEGGQMAGSFGDSTLIAGAVLWRRGGIYHMHT